jgi:Protein tyrosine and serine/threonine kinase
LSRNVTDDEDVYVTTSMFLPVRWLSPETLQEQIVTKASDGESICVDARGLQFFGK